MGAAHSLRASRNSPQIDDLPGDEVAFGADQEIDDIRDIAKLPEPADRLPAEEFVDLLFWDGPDQVRLNRRWAHGVDGDVVRCKLPRQNLRKRVDGRLGSSVDGFTFQLQGGSYGRKIHNPAAPLRHH